MPGVLPDSKQRCVASSRHSQGRPANIVAPTGVEMLETFVLPRLGKLSPVPRKALVSLDEDPEYGEAGWVKRS